MTEEKNRVMNRMGTRIVVAKRMVQRSEMHMPVAATPRTKTVAPRRNVLRDQRGDSNLRGTTHTKQKTGMALRAQKIATKVKPMGRDSARLRVLSA